MSRPIAVSLEEEDPGSWNAFMRSRPEARVSHLWEWAEVIREAYGHRTHHLVARGPDGLSGVLPLVEVRSRFFGDSLCSMPYLDSGGVVASTAAAWSGLVDAACQLAMRLKISSIDLRHGAPPRLGVPARRDKVTLILDLRQIRESASAAGDTTPETLVTALWKAIGAKTRNQVRKAEKEGLASERLGSEGVRAFYRVWRVNMRDLGSPVHRRRWFEAVFRHFGELASTYLVRLGDQVIGGLVALEFGDTVVVPWASSDRRYFRLCPNNLLYWTVIRDAALRGANTFDFGRSSIGSGTYQFKLNWGAAEAPLYWQEIDPTAIASPCPLVDAGGEPPRIDRVGSSGIDTARDRAARVWRRLPVPVATWLGGHLRGGITL